MNREEPFSFVVDPKIKDLGIKGLYLTITNLDNKDNDPEFDAYKNAALEDLKESITNDFIEHNPVLAGFRDLHTKVNRSNKKFVSSPENLLRFFLRHQTIPHINLIVDIYNLVSIQSCLALGAHNMTAISNGAKLSYTDGQENYIPLGQDKPQPVTAGDYAYIDGAHDILCHLEVRQVEKTKVTTSTRECFYIIQGNVNTPFDLIEDTAKKLIALTNRYCGGTATILGRLL